MESERKEMQIMGIRVHPIVLLSVVDHYERVVGNKKG